MRCGPADRLPDGTPDPNIYEPIFDSATLYDYFNWHNGGDTIP
ncbi:MAG: hypothetical protein R3C45_21775 [Phycisphaerales bacterium]